jgi:hypothetical protein
VGLRKRDGRGSRRRRRSAVDGVRGLSGPATTQARADAGAAPVDIGRLSELLRERAYGYFDGFRGEHVSVALVQHRERRNSTIYRFDLSAGETHRRVLVKLAPSGALVRAPRPRATPEVPPAEAVALYYDALALTHARFARLGDPRFGAVPALDFISEIDAVVMGEAEGEQLWKLFARTSPFRRSASSELDDVLRNAGAWLREFHGLEPDRPLARIHDGYQGFVDLLTALTEFLGGSLGERSYFDGVAARTRILAEQILADPPPLGLHFGDYGLTNVLVAPNARVTAIDTLANWYTPIYVDVAYFLTGIKTYRRQIATQGFAFDRERLARFERAFLAGYFGATPAPTREIRLYEVVRLLERWSGRFARNSRRSRAGRTLSLAVVNRFLRRTLDDLLRELESS